MQIVSILLEIFKSLINVEMFIVFVCSFSALTALTFAVHFVNGKRVIYK